VFFLFVHTQTQSVYVYISERMYSLNTHSQTVCVCISVRMYSLFLYTHTHNQCMCIYLREYYSKLCTFISGHEKLLAPFLQKSLTNICKKRQFAKKDNLQKRTICKKGQFAKMGDLQTFSLAHETFECL